MNTPTLSPVQRLIDDHKRGIPVGLYSVCCSNQFVLFAAMQVAQRYDTPLLIEATSNQVDQFGGYTGMTPAQFRDYVYALADEMQFPTERLILGGDHLGPNAWQHLDAQTAMQHAADLVAAYVAAGFHKIHIDCSMRCADDPTVLGDALVAERAAVLVGVAERTAQAHGLPMPVYVIGTEVPVPGGEVTDASILAVTSPRNAAATLEAHRSTFARHALTAAWERVVALVVQPGVDFDQTRVHHYDAQAAATLSDLIAGQPGIVFEAHSTDYQLETALHQLVRDHFAILKVGPAATFALREAWLALEAIERELIPLARQSRLMAVLDQCMVEQPQYWLRHYGGNSGEQRLLRRYALSDRCRYYWGDPAVQAAIQQLVKNLDEVVIPLSLISQYLPNQRDAVSAGRLAPSALALVQDKVAEVLSPYARACHHNRFTQAIATYTESSHDFELSVR